ncbi:MAG TPA: glycoside hydrolase family 16 protein [Bacillota bacterium]|nr:glycoside hydrolase family 16 protein [Bacillota bacterium]
MPDPLNMPRIAAPSKSVPEFILAPSGKKRWLKFADEFEAVKDTDGQPDVNRRKWQTTFWQGSSQRTLWGNLEAQYYVDKHYTGDPKLEPGVVLNPFSYEKPGILTISATKVPQKLWKKFWMGEQRCFASGLLISDKQFDFQYGYIEGRFKLPANRGAWPAFWLLGNDPKLGSEDKAHEWGPEVDIFEFFGHRPTKHSAGVIGRGDEKPTFKFGYNEVGKDLTKEFHTWALEWDTDQLLFLFDGKVWAKGSTPASLNRPMYLLINLAVGGKWYGEEMSAQGVPTKPWQVDEQSMPWNMECDYVRVYQ